jgi:hypothetical protein
MDTYDKLIKNFNDAYFMDIPKFTIFRDGHVFDENMSVKWNREELERVNKETLSRRKSFYEEKANKVSLAREDIIDYLYDEYTSVGRKKIEKLFNKIYDKEFDGERRIDWVIDECEELLEIFSEVE